MHRSNVLSSSVLALSIELLSEAAWADDDAHHHTSEGDVFGASNLTSSPYRANHDGMFQPRQAAHYPSLGEATDYTSRVKFFHVQGLSWGVAQNDVLHSQDHAALRLSAHIPEARSVLSVAATLLQMQPDERLVNGAQVLSLLIKRQVNAEFNYTVPMAHHSRFDSVVSCKIRSNGQSSLSANVRYSVKF